MVFWCSVKTLLKQILQVSQYVCVILLSSTGQFQNLVVEKHGEKRNVAVVKMNRLKTMNALCDALMSEMAVALQQLEEDKDVGCIVITGSQRAFAGMIVVEATRVNHSFMLLD